MKLPEISAEQNKIIQELLLNNNVVIDSVAGSGKTTCNLHIASYFKNLKILLMTYNSKLKIETREKIQKLKLENIEVHSYHSFCVKYYNKDCFTDTTINKIIRDKNERIKVFRYDLIVLDEAQDITSLYFELICKIYKDNNNCYSKLCIFGDKNQCIFGFNKADQRFIEYATEIFKFNSYNWSKCNFSISYRITKEMSLFINNCLLKENRIISNKITNNKPRYIICNSFSDYNNNNELRTFEEIKYYFNLGYKPSDIFVLAPSVKNPNSPIRLLENKIKLDMKGVNIYVPTSDDEKLDEDLLKDKMIFSTFHQTKGLERKVVIIFNFDYSYFKFYNRNVDYFICPNELYVATTRGLEQLTLIHHYTNDFLPFIDKNNLEIYCDYEDYNRIRNRNLIINNDDDINNNNLPISVTNLIKFLPDNVIDDCYNQLEIIENTDFIINKIDIPMRISNDDTIESVSELTGIAIPSMFEYKMKNEMKIYKELINENYENGLKKSKNKKRYNLNKIDIHNLTPRELLYISNCWSSYKNGYLFKIFQITNYNWLSKNKLNLFLERLNNLNISNNYEMECDFYRENEKELLNRKLVGFIDCIDYDNNIVYEFKCVKKLQKEHYLQLALYMYLYELNKIDEKTETKYVLFNIITNEYMIVKCNLDKLRKIVEYLIKTKFVKEIGISNEEFIKNNISIMKTYLFSI